MAKRECSNKSCTSEDCENCKFKASEGIPKEPLNSYSRIGKVIGIVSGKGGVGKSTVTALIARKLASEGYKVGIMDADITGPSIPKMFGVSGSIAGAEEGMLPLESEEGIKIVSMNFFLNSEEDPVIFRGPVIAGVIKQFWTDVYWGELDYLLIDMPPGTGDVPLTVYQSVPVDGIIIVTSPQELVKMIVMKACNMAKAMNIKVLGIIENFSYFECPDCGKRHYIYGESNNDEFAGEIGIPVIAKIPISPVMAGSADKGNAAKADINVELLK